MVLTVVFGPVCNVTTRNIEVSIPGMTVGLEPSMNLERITRTGMIFVMVLSRAKIFSSLLSRPNK